MKKITFEIETITPMFLAGADQSKAELRAASIKGLMRYWWRALQTESDLEKLREQESRIFGSTDDKKGGGSSFSIRVMYDGALKTTKDKSPFDRPHYKVPIPGKTFKMNILEYLAYGAFDNKKGFRGDYIDCGQRFQIAIGIYNEQFLSEILKTMFVFGLFGGIGSRNRNGFGSFNIVNAMEAYENIKDSFSIEKPYEKSNLDKFIQKLSATASYSSFSADTKVFRAKTIFNTSFDALADVGKIYKNDRGRLEKTHQFSKRQYIGAPIVEKKVTHSFLNRHAKPYFIKIAKEGNKYRSYILYLPSQYCTGLSEDRNRKQVNHDEVDRKFAEVCNEFNTFLSESMEPIL